MTEVTQAAQKILELAVAFSLPVIGLPIAIFSWSLLFKARDDDEDWTVNLAVSLKVGGIFLLLALSILLNAAGSEIWLLMRVERLWGLYVLLLLVGSVVVFLVSWVKEQRLSGIQSLDKLSSADTGSESRASRGVPIAASCISFVIGWLVALVWLWSISRGA